MISSVNDQLLQLLDHLEKRPGMYVNPAGYATVVAYLTGLDCGLNVAGNVGFLDDFTVWLHGQVGHHCSMHWSAIVLKLYAKDDERTALQTLFRLMRDFLTQKHRSAK